MNKKYFENVPQIGTLYFEQELFSFENIPIVFVCIDKTNIRYLCICDDVIDEESWIIVKVSNRELLSVLNDERTVLSVYVNKNVIIANKPFGKYIQYIFAEYNKIDPDELPLSDQYLEMKEYLSDYINKIDKLSIISIPMPQLLYYQDDYEQHIMTLNTTYNKLMYDFFDANEQTYTKSIDIQDNVFFQMQLEYEASEDSDSEECDDYNTIMFAA